MTSTQDNRVALVEALALQKQGRLGDAAVLYRQILANDPNQPKALHLMGLLLVQQGQVDEAISHLRQSLVADPQSALCNSDLGLLYYGLENFDEAVAAFRRAIELQPHFPDALCRWGDLYREFCYFDEAKSCYERALAQEPGLSDAATIVAAMHESRQDSLALARRLESLHCSGNIRANVASDSGKLERRELLPFLLNHLGLTGIGVEIGVKEGKFSERILRHWQGNRLYSIDPWREFPSSEYVDVSNVRQSKQDELYLETIRRLLPFERRSIIWRMTSKEAADLLPDGSLDVCYIDADHSYSGVRDDIQLWHPKVRIGGLLAGHDFIPDGTYEFGVFGVQKAVKEFVQANGLELNVTDEAMSGFPSWFVMNQPMAKA